MNLISVIEDEIRSSNEFLTEGDGEDWNAKKINKYFTRERIIELKNNNLQLNNLQLHEFLEEVQKAFLEIGEWERVRSLVDGRVDTLTSSRFCEFLKKELNNAPSSRKRSDDIKQYFLYLVNSFYEKKECNEAKQPPSLTSLKNNPIDPAVQYYARST